MSTPTQKPEGHWTEEIVSARYKDWHLHSSAVLAVALLTLACLVGLARYGAEFEVHLLASAVGLIFGFLARRWQKPRESG